MRFTPLSEEEAAAQSSGVWPDDIYDYEVIEATEETSRTSGNDMFHLQVAIFNEKGQRKILHAYLVQSEKARWKIREFCKSSGLMDAYNTGSLIEGEIVGRTGRCEVATEEGSAGYPPKNVVRSWMQKPDKRQTSLPIDRRSKRPAGPDLDDEVPF